MLYILLLHLSPKIIRLQLAQPFKSLWLIIQHGREKVKNKGQSCHHEPVQHKGTILHAVNVTIWMGLEHKLPFKKCSHCGAWELMCICRTNSWFFGEQFRWSPCALCTVRNTLYSALQWATSWISATRISRGKSTVGPPLPGPPLRIGKIGQVVQWSGRKRQLPLTHLNSSYLVLRLIIKYITYNSRL